MRFTTDNRGASIAEAIAYTLIALVAAGAAVWGCLLYTSDAADERSSVDLGGRRIIKKKKRESNRGRRYHVNKTLDETQQSKYAHVKI